MPVRKLNVAKGLAAPGNDKNRLKNTQALIASKSSIQFVYFLISCTNIGLGQAEQLIECLQEYSLARFAIGGGTPTISF